MYLYIVVYSAPVLPSLKGSVLCSAPSELESYPGFANFRSCLIEVHPRPATMSPTCNQEFAHLQRGTIPRLSQPQPSLEASMRNPHARPQGFLADKGCRVDRRPLQPQRPQQALRWAPDTQGSLKQGGSYQPYEKADRAFPACLSASCAAAASSSSSDEGIARRRSSHAEVTRTHGLLGPANK